MLCCYLFSAQTTFPDSVMASRDGVTQATTRFHASECTKLAHYPCNEYVQVEMKLVSTSNPESIEVWQRQASLHLGSMPALRRTPGRGTGGLTNVQLQQAALLLLSCNRV